MVIGVLVVVMLPSECRFTLPLQSAPRECADHMMPRQSSSPWTGFLFAVEQALPMKKKQGEREII